MNINSIETGITMPDTYEPEIHQLIVKVKSNNRQFLEHVQKVVCGEIAAYRDPSADVDQKKQSEKGQG